MNHATPFVDNMAQAAATNHSITSNTSEPPLHNQQGHAPGTNSLPHISSPIQKRKHEEFTIAQKLSILAQLRGKQKVSVPTLAARHNTSRTTIYRWKKEEARLNRLAKRSMGNCKRATLSHTGATNSNKSGSNKFSRKSYNDEFTAAEKLNVLKECHANPSTSVKEIADRFGTHPRSIYRWKKDEEKLQQLVQSDKPNVKRLAIDGLYRVKMAIEQFCWGTQSVTGTMIAAKAKEVRDELLAEHDISPFLTDGEVKALMEFTASSSWGRKLIVKLGWKNGEQQDQHSPEAVDMSLNEASFAPHPESQEDYYSANSKQLRMKRQIDDMKKEINLLKRKIIRLEMRNDVLEKENSELKMHQERFNSELVLGDCRTGDDVEKNELQMLNPYPLE
ncbi:hypothetical protein HJC23_004417 [Cyclotella cryptica]|uniref:Transposase n=1 Tax=Cyclotella cryptica TaxID=29204 RepID=A0ABD3QGN3_9STRA|eukprot:CCRYP_006021-RA/>CCRYP_006021-RA protein AED:0.22 eAED:0.22 QI:0/-1/0/1/-1/1/1/0/390